MDLFFLLEAQGLLLIFCLLGFIQTYVVKKLTIFVITLPMHTHTTLYSFSVVAHIDMAFTVSTHKQPVMCNTIHEVQFDSVNCQ